MTFISSIHRFGADKRGSYAVEFAVVSPLFIGLVLAICQYGLFFMARQSLDSALQRAARSLLTGSFQKANAAVTDPEKLLAALRAQMCVTTAKDTLPIFDCSQVRLDVKVVTGFASSNASTSAVDSTTGMWAAGFGTSYTSPRPKSIAVVRAALKYAIFVNPLQLKFGAFSDGSLLIQSGYAFRVEQY